MKPSRLHFKECRNMEKLWGTDATRFYTKEDGWCWFFVAVDHCVTDVVGWHVAKKGDRAGGARADPSGRTDPRGVPLPPRLRESRGGQAGDRRVHRTLQPRVAPGAARVSDPGPGPGGAHPEGGMTRPPTCPGTRDRYTRTMTAPRSIGN
jgi:hypothetical protein